MDIIIEFGKDSIILIKRKNPPYGWALPGGFVDIGEDLITAAKREAKEETSLSIYNMKELGVYSDPKRDPRGHTVSVVYYAKAKGKPKASDDAKEIGIFNKSSLPKLAFDHDKIVKDFFNTKEIDINVRTAIEEDVGETDVTTALLFCDRKIVKKANIIAKEELILSGVEPFFDVCTYFNIKAESCFKAGERVESGSIIFSLEGDLKDLLKGERVALNFLQHLSGIATLTRKFKYKIKDTNVEILDTRKTTPNLREFEKKAVIDGGGTNHRMGLFDSILVKDNHIKAIGGISRLRKIRKKSGNLKFEIEVRNLEEVECALLIKPDIIMLDNFSIMEAIDAIKIINKRTKVEISGGITIDNILEYAKCRPDFISIGAITHSARAVDICMKIVDSM